MAFERTSERPFEDHDDFSDDFVVLDNDDVSDYSDYNAAGILPESLEIIQQIRQWLQPTDFAADSSEYKKHLNSYVVGTGNWIQQTETYQAWHDSPSSSSLWIKAIPGAGKSVFAAMIADKLSQTEKVPVLYFFFRQIIATNHDPQYLVRDWLAQLLPYSPLLQSKLKQQMEERQILDDISIDEFWHSLLLAVASIPKVYCVADALDEMDISKLSFLDRLVELGKQRETTVKILMTSRPLPRIESKLRTPSILEISILQIRLQQNMIDTDIALYVDHRLQQQKDAGLADDVRETIRNGICTKGQGSFLYARLMMDKLLDGATTEIGSSSEDVDRLMTRLPVSLEEMYNGMLIDHATRSGVPRELQLTILQWVTHSVRPLRLLELAAMIDSLDGKEKKSKDTKALVRTACGPLLEILEDETVSIIHHSFTEFLIDPEREGRSSAEAGHGQFPVIKTKETHRLLAATCLKYLTSGRLAEWKVEKRGRGDSFNSFHSKSNNQGGIKLQNPFLDYAMSNICAHVARLESSDKALFAALDDFMKPNNHDFVSWIDLTWAGDLIENISALHIGAYWGMLNYCKHLLELGHLDVNGLDSKSRTPISWASARGHDDVVKILLQNGATADLDDNVGLKPLHYAAMANHSAVVRSFLAAGVDAMTVRTKDYPGRMCGNAPSAIGYTPVQYACKGGGVESVLEFMPYLSSKDLSLALAWAAETDRTKVVITLLESPNISIDSTDNDRVSTALYYAAERQNPEMIRALLEKGADPNSRSVGLPVESSRRSISWALGIGSNQLKNPQATPLHAVTGKNCRTRGVDKESEALRECCELLIDAGGDVNAVDECGRCPIHYCVHPAITSMLLQHGASATVESGNGSTPIHYACERSADDSDQETLIELLVSANADINARRRVDGRRPLHVLVAKACKDLPVNSFLKYKPEVNAEDDDGNTPLHLAVHGYLIEEVIQALLNAGADANKRNRFMETPIHSIAGLSSGPDVVQLLVDAGADLEARDRLGRTALLSRVQEVVQYSLNSEVDTTVLKLLELGAKVDARDVNGNTVLHLVCQKLGSPDLLRHLIGAGADPKWLNYEGNTLVHEASLVTEMVRDKNKPARLRFLELLQELGVPVSQTNYSGATALHIACSTVQVSQHDGVMWKGLIDLLTGPNFNIGINEGDKNGIRAIHSAATLSESVVGWLVEKGADPGVRTGEGQTPLQVACRARRTNVVGQLLELYQTRSLSHLINWRDERGRTALHDAAKSGRPEAVKLLLDAGADPNMKDKKGLTPLHVCSEFDLEKSLWVSQATDHCSLGPRKAANVLIRDTERPMADLSRSMWKDIRSEHDTVRIRDSIRLLLAHGADLAARCTMGRKPLDSAVQVGCEVMVGELLPLTEKAFENGEIQLGHREQDSIVQTPFTEQYLTLRSKHSPSILRDLVKEHQSFSEWTELLRLDEDALFDELITLHVDFQKKTTRKGSFLETLVGWGYGTLLEKFGPQVSLFHEQMRRESDVDSTPGKTFEPLLHRACQRELPNMEVVTILVDKLGVDVNTRSVSRGGSAFGAPSGQTALHVLAEGQHWWQKGAAEFLLQRGADIELQNDRGESPLSWCVGSKNSPGFWRGALADVLLKHGADPNSVSKDGLTCLNKAGSDSEIIRMLVRHGADTSSGDTPALFTAIASRDLATVAAILESGAGCNVRRKSNTDDTPRWARREEVPIPATEVPPLLYAASTAPHIEDNKERALPVVRLLLEKRADPYEVFDGDKTVLHHLLEFGGILQPFLEIPELHLEHRDPKGRTLLLAGCRSSGDQPTYVNREQKEKTPILAAILYGMGADLLARDSQGMNALHHLLQSTPYNNESYMETLPLFIKDAPLLVRQKDVHGNTPLHYALRKQRVWSIETLLSAGADPLEPDSDCNTGLHHLARVICTDPRRARETQLFRRFVDLGVPINARNKAGDSPLFEYLAVIGKDHTATNMRSRTVRDDLTIFKEAGADFLARNNAMECALHLAAKSIEGQMIGFFRAYDHEYNKEHLVDRFRFLMELGCDPLAEDINQRTALDVAAACGNEKILKLFQRGEKESEVAFRGGSYSSRFSSFFLPFERQRESDR